MRRKFFESTEQSPRLVAWILRQIAHLYHIEKRLRETKAGPALREAVRAAESVLTRLPGMLAKDAITLIPANWLKERSGKPVCKVA